MIQFAIYDSFGRILRTGACPDEAVELQAKPDEFLYVGPVGDGDSIAPGAGVLIPNSLPPRRLPPVPAPRPPDPPYVVNRRRAYPTTEQQLDWLWHAMDQNILPRIEPMYSQIKEIKLLHPKTVDINDGDALTEVL